MPTLPLPEAKDRVAQYLATLGDAARGARVVGLTGDASDRKYFRVLPNDGDPFVLAVHAAAIDGETLPFVNVGRLLEAMPVPTPRLLGYDNALGILALAGSRRRDAAGAPGRAAVPGPRRALPPGGRAHRDACRRAAPS